MKYSEASEAARSSVLGKTILALGLSISLISIALTVRAYMPCPFGDEWFFLDDIARGNGPTSWQWLWSQHNEHRLAIGRLLVWLDLTAFHGRNISLVIETYLFLGLAWAAICYALERFTDFPTPLKRTLQGLFAFSIFHPNQQENLTWAFQTSFVLAFAIAIVALLAATFLQHLRRQMLATFGVAVAPILAAMNVAGGLLIGPVVLGVAATRRLRARFVAIVLVIFALSTAAYLWHFKPPDPAHPPLRVLADPKGIFVYVLTYFGASWTRLLPHKERITALLSIVCFAVLVAHSFRKKERTTGFEWFSIAECSLMLAISVATALGRLKFGVGQAYASRYQTPAMLYWAGLGALVIIIVWRKRPQKFRIIQAVLLLLMVLSALTSFKIWATTISRANSLQRACDAFIGGSDDKETAKTLGAVDAGIEPGAALLRKIWRDRAQSGKRSLQRTHGQSAGH